MSTKYEYLVNSSRPDSEVLNTLIYTETSFEGFNISKVNQKQLNEFTIQMYGEPIEDETDYLGILISEGKTFYCITLEDITFDTLKNFMSEYPIIDVHLKPMIVEYHRYENDTDKEFEEYKSTFLDTSDETSEKSSNSLGEELIRLYTLNSDKTPSIVDLFILFNLKSEIIKHYMNTTYNILEESIHISSRDMNKVVILDKVRLSPEDKLVGFVYDKDKGYLINTQYELTVMAMGEDRTMIPFAVAFKDHTITDASIITKVITYKDVLEDLTFNNTITDLNYFLKSADITLDSLVKAIFNHFPIVDTARIDSWKDPTMLDEYIKLNIKIK